MRAFMAVLFLTVSVPALLVPSVCASGTLPDSQSCSEGHAARILGHNERAHILVALRDRGDDESKAIAGVWRRIFLRIPDVRLVDGSASADLEVFVAVREVHDKSGSLVAYVWHVAVVEPWAVICETNPRTYYILDQPKQQFMNYASTVETASEMIQQSVNSIEDTELQAIREMKRK